MEYKILTQKDKWFSGKFDPVTLENALNSYCEMGYRVRMANSASTAAGRDEIIILLERDGEGEMSLSYKVLSQKDKWFSRKFDPAALEVALNSYAEEGWSVKAGDTASIPGFFGSREEFIVILERDDIKAEMFEYKVVSQKDKWFSGKFDPLALENLVNSYAQEEWEVALATTASFYENREEYIVILKRRAG